MSPWMESWNQLFEGFTAAVGTWHRVPADLALVLMLAGATPIYEVQGCYVLAALLTTVGRADVFCNCFNADFVRSYSLRAGRPMLSVFAGSPRQSGVRPNIRPAMEAAGLEIPDLRSTAEILEYAGRNPRSYYVMQTRYGPWLPFEKEPEHFALIAVFPAKKPVETVRLFEPVTNRHRVEPKK